MLLRTLIIFVSLLAASPLYSVVITAEHQQRARNLVSKMTLDEKLQYIHGDQRFTLYPIERLGIPSIFMADGPQGIRIPGKPATLYPCGVMGAATWNRPMIYKYGKSLGSDARARGVDILLGPGVNIYRCPLNGRNFEYFGEDPYLSGEIAVNYIKGVQDNGVIATVKHFCANNQEWDRHHTSSDVDERTLHEIYFTPFRKAVQEGKVGAVMNSYNLLNGVHASENPWLNIEILRKLWGFKGILMSDWTSLYSTVNAINGGLDLEMPAGDHFNVPALKAALGNGLISEKTIDDKITNILATAIAFGVLDRKQGRVESIPLDDPDSRLTALETAREGMVLLKNDDNILPLKKGKTLILGQNADTIVYGGGSGAVKAFSTVKPGPALKSMKKGTIFMDSEQLYKTIKVGKKNSDITYTPEQDEIIRATIGSVNGYRLIMNGDTLIQDWGTHRYSRKSIPVELKKGETYNFRVEFMNKKPNKESFSLQVLNQKLLDKELKSVNDVVVCTGFDALTEGESNDRKYGLQPYEEFFINYIADRNPNTVVVLNSGGAVKLKAWGDNVKAILCAWYPGQEGGTAIAEILTGKISPSGKLPFTWDGDLEESPIANSYYANRQATRNTETKECAHVEYKEGIFLGYRGYDRAGKKPMYPFGHGLSYSDFALSDLSVEKNTSSDNGLVQVSFNIKNVGKMTASETVQVYVSDKECSVPRPLKELKGFEKISLKPGESKRVSINLPKEAFEFYDIYNHKFVMEPGEFEILVGNSSANLPLSKAISL